MVKWIVEIEFVHDFANLGSCQGPITKITNSSGMPI